MYHYDVQTALEELKEDALLPHPVRLRDMILRTKLGAEEARELNREFQSDLSHFGETQKIARAILEQLAVGEPKAPRSGRPPGIRCRHERAGARPDCHAQPVHALACPNKL